MGRFTRAHGPECVTPYVGECKEFSTDGTRLGADIAHQFRTTDEEEIKASDSLDPTDAGKKHLTGMDAEQAEWESADSEGWGSW